MILSFHIYITLPILLILAQHSDATQLFLQATGREIRYTIHKIEHYALLYIYELGIHSIASIPHNDHQIQYSPHKFLQPFSYIQRNIPHTP